MRKNLCTLVLMLVIIFIFQLKMVAQTANKPNVGLLQTPNSSQTPNAIPGAYSGPVNYVRTRTAKAPVATESDFLTAPYQQAQESTAYFDGLGRPLQTVVRQGSPGTDPKDLVAPVIYDAFGREQFKYLPYAQNAGVNTADGAFKVSAFGDQDYFYKNVYKDVNNTLMYAGETFLYGRTVYEASPLNRATENYAPGNSWVGSAAAAETDRHGMEIRYAVNTAIDNVQLWTVTDGAASVFGTYTASTYAPGELTKLIAEDERNGQTIEFKDKEGRVVLKKILLTANRDMGAGSGHDGWLNTYYIYDGLGNLRCVMQPEGIRIWGVATGALTNSGILTEQCFRYEYDQRQRMIMKKVPGAELTEMVYDKRDRLVFSRDGNMRQKDQWMVYLYDNLNRPVITGILSSNQNRADLQTYVDGLAVAPSSVEVVGQPSSSIAAILTVTAREPGKISYQAIKEIVFTAFESEPGAEFVAEIVTGAEAGFNNTIEVVANPLPAGKTFTALTTTYYDDYTWTDKVFTDGYNGLLDAAANPYPESLPTNQQQAAVGTRGMLTGSRVRILEDPDNLAAGPWLTTANFYDNKGRLIQTNSDNYKGGTNITTSRYDFTGNTICAYVVNNTPRQLPAMVKVKTVFEYDHGGRLENIWKTINDEEAKKALIVHNSYDELGNLKTKELGSKRNTDGTYSSMPIERLNYNYNIRGWLKGINMAYAKISPEIGGTPASPWFGMELSYDWGSTDLARNTYNGNISAIKWRSRGDDQRRAYGFSYDAANRLLGADFSQYNGTGYVDNGTIQFDMVMGDGTTAMSAYDVNGNIKAMKQWGLKLGSSSVIDQLTYNYYPNSNILKSVEEPAGSTDNKLGDFTDKHAGVSDDYGYDPNGNMITDLNKGINGNTGINQSGGTIIYNHLNLPWKITIKDDVNPANIKGTITYIYDATGNKLEKKVFDNTNTSSPNKSTAYNGGMVYEDDALQFIGHEEGRTTVANITGTLTYNYDYFIKDHLGNVRMVLTDELKTDVYPAATLEGNVNTSSDAIYEEKAFYNIDPAKLAPMSAATGIPVYQNNNIITNPNPKSNTTANSTQLYQLQATSAGGVTGLGITLKVMAGDRIDIYGKSYYFQNNINPNYPFPVMDILTGLFGAPASAAGAKGASASSVNAITSINTVIDAFLDDPSRATGATTIPKAYINYMLLDENFNLVKGDFSRVRAANSLTDHYTVDGKFHNIDVTKNGYIYVYVSNESLVKVFFDNLQVVHTRGALVEETHYYPFGLTMAGISSKAIGKLENKYKFNDGTELNKDLDLNWYETNFRSLDPQLGRFWQIDPMADVMYEYSPYAYANNNPLTFNDPLGLLSDSTNPQVLQTVTVTAQKRVPKEFQNYISFSNGRPGSIASDDDWPAARYSDENNLLKAWAKGKGAENRVYLPSHRMTKRLKNANAVKIARAKFYKRYITDYKNGLSLRTAKLLNDQLNFGGDGLIMAGFDIVEQFVGGMTIDINVDESGENLLFVAKNTTGKHSAFYHAAEDINRVPGQITPMGNMNQVYIWKEPIGPGIKAYEENAEYNNRSMIYSAPGFN